MQDKESFYQLAKSVAPPRADSHHDDDSIHSASIPPADESPSATSPPQYTFNPQIRESRKLPKGKGQPEKDTRPRALTLGVTSPVNKPKSSLSRSVSSPKGTLKDGWKDSPTVPQLVVSGSSAKSSPGLLDVDIPTVHMERYSVMFSNLLQQTSSAQNSGGSSALLQRRQGNSEKLKPLDPLSTQVRTIPYIFESNSVSNKPNRTTRIARQSPREELLRPPLRRLVSRSSHPPMSRGRLRHGYPRFTALDLCSVRKLRRRSPRIARAFRNSLRKARMPRLRKAKPH